MSKVKKIVKSVSKVINKIPGANVIVPAALAAYNPALAAAYAGANTYANGGSLGKALLSAGLSYGGSALGGNNTVFGDSLSGAVKSGLGSIGDGVSGALNDFGNFSGLNNIYSTASGALGDAYNSASDAFGSAYNGSAIQDVFNSGSDALKSIGIGSNSGALPTGGITGGGSSSYDGFGNGIVRGSADDLLGNLGSDGLATGADMASRNYISPLSSIALGNLTNNAAEEDLLRSARDNKALLAPYLNFSFDASDLQNDPGYQFNLSQGNQALDRAQLSRGGYFSGNALKEAQTFGQGLADNTYNSAFQRALQGRNAGFQGALAQAGINDSIGNIKAASTINNGNLYSGALGDILGGNSYTNSGALRGGLDIQDLLRQLGVA